MTPRSRTASSCGCARHLEWLEVRGYSPRTVGNRRSYLAFVVDWLSVRGLARPHDVTKPVLERYQRHLYYLRQRDGRPLSFRAQHQRLVAVRAFFKWLSKAERHSRPIPLPRSSFHDCHTGLPPPVLTHDEVEQRHGPTGHLESPVGHDGTGPCWKSSTAPGVRRSELGEPSPRGSWTPNVEPSPIREGKGKRDQGRAHRRPSDPLD